MYPGYNFLGREEFIMNPSVFNLHCSPKGFEPFFFFFVPEERNGELEDLHIALVGL